MDKHRPRVHVGSTPSGSLGEALRRVLEGEETENDWRNFITVPRPEMPEPHPELVGQTVVPHSCYASQHGKDDNIDNCICEFIGKPIVIAGISERRGSVGGILYHIEGSPKLILEGEFLEKESSNTIKGFILEGPDGKFLTAAFVWMTVDRPLDGYLHNTQVVRDLLGYEFPNGRPVKAYPATYNYKTREKRIIGKPIIFGELEL